VATYFVWTGGSNTAPYDTWAKAATAFGTAVTAATSANDVIKVAHVHSESIAADTTYTFAANVRVISCNKDSSDTPTAGALVGAQVTNYGIIFVGAYKVYVYGMTFKTGTATSGISTSIQFFYGVDGADAIFEDCDFELNGANGWALKYWLGANSIANSTSVRFTNGCTFKFSQTDQSFLVYLARIVFENCSITGSVPSPLITGGNDPFIYFEGCDLSLVTGTLVGDHGGNGYGEISFVNCKLGTSTIMAAPTTVTHKGNLNVQAFNCSSGDTHYALFHGDAFGTTTVSAAIYANDGASYNGTNRCSWTITTRADNCSFYTPYVSPWIEMYNADASTSITPYLEGLRDGSATVIQDDEVWAEFSRQGTSGFPLAVFSNDRMALLGTPANQTSTLGAGDWSGEGGTYSTFKLAAPSAFTPAEIGPLKARVIVGEPGLTINVDPQVRT
jgi:hypothetical protein